MSVRQFWSPRGNPVTLSVRDDTSDLSVAYATFGAHEGGECQDEYRLASYRLEGHALDVGAHIGVVTMALLADNPGLTVTAIEPLADNAAMIAENLRLNGWESRCEVVVGAVGATRVGWDFAGEDGGFRRVNRYIGGLQEQQPHARSFAEVPRVDLAAHLPAVFAKWDCEGCEWAGLPSILSVPAIVGEWHGDPGIPGLEAVLGATHAVEADSEGSAGRFWATAVPAGVVS